MMRHLLRLIGPVAAALLLSCTVAGAQVTPLAPPVAVIEAPAPEVRRTGWVTDAADILPDEAEARLAAKLAELERSTRHRMVVVTLPTLGGRDVADVADKLGNARHIGHGDGVVVLVAPNERRMRIATADGIRPMLPDETCQQIIDETMIPRFRADDFPGGIEAGVDAIIAHVGSDPPPVES